MIDKKFLLIVEGSVTEPTIFQSLFEKYGFAVNIGPKMNLDDFHEYDYIADSSEICIIQGPRNRISELLKLYDKDKVDLQRIFKKFGSICSGIFLIYDVDHTSNDDLEKLSNLLQDEAEGMLLVSFPCIEIMAEINRDEEINCTHLTEYKHDLNKRFDLNYHQSAKKYIIENFERLAIDVIDKNVKDFNNTNIMEHPKCVIELINKYNIRKSKEEGERVIYRYFTTVVYVALAYILGLTKEIDNADTVKNYFKKFIK